MTKNIRTFFPHPRQTRPKPATLKERYVESQFADPNVLGVAAADAWLASEAKNATPDLCAWNALTRSSSLSLHFYDRVFETLRAFVDPFDFRQTRPPAEEMHPLLLAFVSSLDRYRAQTFMGYGACPIVLFLQQTLPVAYVVEMRANAGALVFKDVDMSDLIDLLTATWARGGPKFKEARALLCEKAKIEVAQLRAEYEREFDQAVAVSFDGSRIASAERIVLFDDASPRRLQVYPASRFMQEKLDLEAGFMGTPFDIDEEGMLFLGIRSNGRPPRIRGFVESILKILNPQRLLYSTVDEMYILVSHLAATGGTTFPTGGARIR